jgi:hypothetical protein
MNHQRGPVRSPISGGRGRSFRVSGGIINEAVFEKTGHGNLRRGAKYMRGHVLKQRLAGGLLAIAITVAITSREAAAQVVAGSPYMTSYRVSDYFVGPGWYGTSYGFASYGFPQTYSVYSAFPASSYAANYPPYGLLPGRYGVGLWRPGYVAPGYVYGA